MLRTAPFVPPYGADGAALFGRYDVMDAVKTIEPLIPSSMNFFAAAVAQKYAPKTFRLKSCSSCGRSKLSAG